MNFNDFGASCVTLFHIMIVNNWYVTCDMFTDIVGSFWPRVYFITFWVICVLIMLNLVVSFVLEIYAEVGASVQKAHKRSEFVRTLKNNFREYVHIEDLSNANDTGVGVSTSFVNYDSTLPERRTETDNYGRER